MNDKKFPAGTFHRVCGNKNIHISDENNILCGTKVKFQNGKLLVKIEDGVLKEFWATANKWVTVPDFDYCDRCMKILKSRTS